MRPQLPSPASHTNRRHSLRASHVLFELGLRTRIETLEQEREGLKEEIQQLRATVQIYAEVVRRLSASGRVASADFANVRVAGLPGP
jgi:hypothetical protein